MNRVDELRKRVAQAPTSPGVYRWLNSKGDVLYIGKAKNLRNRLKSYVQKSPDASVGPWKISLMKHIADVDLTVTDNEMEALILETNLIKEEKPKYNVLMKDDKNYVYIRIDTTAEYPSISIVRNMLEDKAKYFGPYIQKYAVTKMLDALHEIYQWKACSISIDALNKGKTPERACMQYQIQQCNGLCTGALTKEEYRKRITNVEQCLRGNFTPTKTQLVKMMQEAAQEKKFERAAKLRDTLVYIDTLQEQQTVSDTSGENTDAIGIALQHNKAQVVIMRERGGKLIGERTLSLAGEAESVTDVLQQFIPQFYSSETDIPDLLLIQEELEDKPLLEAWLQQIREKHVEVRSPERGKKSRLLKLALSNAEHKIQQQFAKWEAAAKNIERALSGLKEALHLSAIPKRIEGYDISHLGGTETVGSMVVMKHGKPANAEYRSFTLKTVQAGEMDDYKALKEVLKRRLQHLKGGIKTEEKDWHTKGVSFGKARKKEEGFLRETIAQHEGVLEPETINYKEYLVARNAEDMIIGFVAIVSNHKNVLELDPLWVHKDYRSEKLGQFLCRKILTRYKQKVYLLCKPSLEEYYAQIGFHTVREGPSVLQKKVQEFVKKYDAPAEIIMMTEPKDQKEDVSLSSTPDLLVIDGGKGQLSAVMEVLKELHMTLPVIGLAKREEEVFLPTEKIPVDLPRNSQASFLLQRLRDEAHRFANRHREKRLSKGMIGSVLDDVEGIGPKTKRELLKHFGSVEVMKNASDEDLRLILSQRQMESLRKHLT